MNAVFQTAAVVWDPSLPASLYDDVNIKGNRQVIEACRSHRVSRLVYTSTVDVVLDGSRPIVNGDESLPYPKKIPADPYCRSKITAEKDVIAANGTGGLHTCCIRPAGIYGPKDRYHLPAVIKLAGTRKNVRLGSGSARFSHVYVGNVAHAHILAAQHLGGNSPVSGRCYFITDHTPAENFFTFMEPFLERLGLPLPRKSIPYVVAYTLAWLNELIHPKSTFCRFAVVQTCVDRTFVHHRAAADFGYAPLFSKEEAFEKTIEWLKDRRDSIRV
jgi:nucleoside-diphosphate-sugar epimerase